MAMEMTKWFDTNYHYIVPEFVKDQEFSLFDTNKSFSGLTCQNRNASYL